MSFQSGEARQPELSLAWVPLPVARQTKAADSDRHARPRYERFERTMRLSEVVSDSANALAIEATVRQLSQPTDEQVHLAASHRQLRAQVFAPGAATHFRLFTLVSSARDTGSARTEADLLRRHLAFWTCVLGTTVPSRTPQIELAVFDHPVVAARLADTVLPAHSGERVRLVVDPARARGRGYHTSLAMRLSADAGTFEIGEGGFTTSTAQLTGNAKERCLVSCIATRTTRRSRGPVVGR
jgi:hypothetical protein